MWVVVVETDGTESKRVGVLAEIPNGQHEVREGERVRILIDTK